MNVRRAKTCAKSSTCESSTLRRLQARNTTKAAVIGFTKSLAKEVAIEEICINAVAFHAAAVDCMESGGAVLRREWWPGQLGQLKPACHVAGAKTILIHNPGFPLGLE
jgi:NAD(P)-dependent dehydrogenase (short-subunit alcohol dehydrogenase family)